MKSPPVPVLKEFSHSLLQWLGDELKSPTCHSPFTKKDVPAYLDGLMPPAQAASFKRHLRRNTELKAFVVKCMADIPESVERVKQRVRLLTQPRPVETESSRRLRLLEPPAKDPVLTGTVVGGIRSLEELPAAACQVKTSTLVKEVKVNFPGVSKAVRLGVYLSAREQEKPGETHRFTVSVPDGMRAADLAKLKRWCLVCGTLELPLNIQSVACDASILESVVSSSEWHCKMTR